MLRFRYSLLLAQYGYLLIKPTMTATDLNNKLRLKQNELNTATNADDRKKLENDIQIIKYKMSIERIKQIIEILQASQPK